MSQGSPYQVACSEAGTSQIELRAGKTDIGILGCPVIEYTHYQESAEQIRRDLILV
jgi:hypothetical protein